jgi:pyruvate dehydrogenase (quinone)
MKNTVSDHILERLSEWGTTHVFGYPGDGINGLMGAFNRNDRGCRFVQARHEEMAAFMACAYAKFTGQVGVCMATSGPGAIHLLNGLYDAKMDHHPVVAPWSLSSGKRPPQRWAAPTNRRSISTAYSRMWRANTCTPQ